MTRKTLFVLLIALLPIASAAAEAPAPAADCAAASFLASLDQPQMSSGKQQALDELSPLAGAYQASCCSFAEVRACRNSAPPGCVSYTYCGQLNECICDYICGG